MAVRPLPDVVVTEVAFAPDQVLPWHTHSSASVCVVMDGTYFEQSDHTSRELKPFDVAFKGTGVEHRNQYGPKGARCLILELLPSFVDHVGTRLPASHGAVCGSSRELGYLGRQLQGEFLEPDDLSPMVIGALGLELIAGVIRAERHRETRIPRWLRSARDLLRAEARRPMELGDLAQTVGIHPVHLAHSFRRAYGLTIGEYVRTVRVKHATALLRDRSVPLSRVALSCGFFDQSHFTRTFKRYMSVTPGEYRRHYGATRRSTPPPSPRALGKAG